MKEPYEALFRQITATGDEDGEALYLMQEFVSKALNDQDIDTLFEAADRFNMLDLEDEEIDESSFLMTMIDLALESDHIDLARRAASKIKDGVSHPVFGYIDIAKRTKSEEDFRLVRHAANTLDAKDPFRKAQAYVDLFAITHASEDRESALRLFNQLLQESPDASSLTCIISIARETKVEEDFFQCFNVLERAEERHICTDRMITEFLDLCADDELPEYFDRTFSSVRNQNLLARIERVKKTFN